MASKLPVVKARGPRRRAGGWRGQGDQVEAEVEVEALFGCQGLVGQRGDLATDFTDGTDFCIDQDDDEM